MKMFRTLIALIALCASPALFAQTLVDCAPSTPCTTTGPASTGTGDPAYMAFGKINNNFLGITTVAHGGTGASSLAGASIPTFSGVITAGDCVAWSTSVTVTDAGFACGSGSGNFGTLNGGTNTAAAMIVGTGASITPFGAGIVTATGLATTPTQCSGGQFSTGIATSGNANCSTPAGGGNVSTSGSPSNFQTAVWTSTTNIGGVGPGTSGYPLLSAGGSAYPAYGQLNLTVGVTGALPIANGGTGATTLAGANIPVWSGSLTATHCAEWLSSGVLEDSGAVCGGGGSGAFSALTSGTNTTATMTVGTGSTVTVSGTGVNNANQINSGAIPASAALTSTNGGSQFTATSVGAGLAVSGATLGSTQLINPETGTTYTFLTSDAAKLVTFNNASSCAVSLPAATAAGFTAGFSVDVENLGAASCVITPTTSTINGVSTLTVAQNQGCSISSDGANYQVSACTAVASGGAAFSAITGGTNTAAAMLVGTGASLGPTGSGTVTANAYASGSALTVNGTVNLNASNNAATNIGTGTTTSAITIGNHSNLTSFDGPIALAQGTSYSGSSWTTAGILFSQGAATVNDSTATGTVTTEAINAFGAPTLTSTSVATVTNLSNLYVAAPAASTNVTASHLLSLQTPGIIASVQSPAALTAIDGLWLDSVGTATSSNNFYSPALHFTGQGWKTGSGGLQEPADFQNYLVVDNGAANPTGYLIWSASVGGGGYSQAMSLSTSGILAATSFIEGSGFVTNITTTAGNTGAGIYLQGANNPAIAANGTEVESYLSTGITNLVPLISGGTTAGASGCSISAHSGGATAGQYTSGTTGTCTVTLTLPATTTAYVCVARDVTTAADTQAQTGVLSTTSVTITGTTVSGDVISWGCPTSY